MLTWLRRLLSRRPTQAEADEQLRTLVASLPRKRRVFCPDCRDFEWRNCDSCPGDLSEAGRGFASVD